MKDRLTLEHRAEERPPFFANTDVRISGKRSALVRIGAFLRMLADPAVVTRPVMLAVGALVLAGIYIILGGRFKKSTR